MMEYGDWEGYGMWGNGGGGYKTHEHFRNGFLVDNDTTVYLTSSRGFEDGLKRKNGPEIDFGVYLDGAWKRRVQPTSYDSVVNMPDGVELPSDFITRWDNPTTPVTKGMYLVWPDRGVPAYSKVDMLLEWLNPQLDAGKKVEIACFGGHGRTGTLAAALVITRHKGKKPLDTEKVISYIRTAYCKDAIESYDQEKFLYILNGQTPPEPPKPKVYTPPTGSGTSTTKKGKGSWGDRADTIHAWFLKEPHKRLAINWFDVERKEVGATLALVGPDGQTKLLQ